MILNRLIFIIVIFCLGFIDLSGQITSAKITFERKTNLYKQFKGEDMSNWIKEADKIKLDYFELYFNDTISVFKPQESELRENLDWSTEKNTIYQNFITKKRFLIKDMWGEEMNLTDTLVKRKWKITESTRKIAGFNCRKAVWKANDTTRIYAWFSYDIVPSTGPESFNGLPGTILGLATEDGGIIYFAKKVEMFTPTASTFIPPAKKKKVYTIPEIKAEMTKRYGKEKWFKGTLERMFDIW